ncbi:GNAT family N-acetyltransferase [Plantactinospora sp. KBS50]|uniref:GNAT family N-acetyltransferase n=1 Tax=Plantactinospora sp. KBS50 TaxID=2024580 RepID=UPI000BAA9F65|nr:GNAT family protein [Plantactinospora sp. KBS50]ASW53461.1 GNAT family N-acetyltransferase [Plantactinospora sp. KBS50]
MFRPSYPIRTARLALRPITIDDVDDVHAYQRRPEVCRWMLGAEPRTIAQSHVSVATMARQNALRAEGDVLTLAAEVDPSAAGANGPGTGRVAGTAQLVWHSAADHTAEIGYVFNPEFHGRGLATEAVVGLLGWGFDEFGLHRVYGRCHADNEASARLMSRIGMRLEARHVQSYRFRGGWADQLVFAMLAREWRSRSRTGPGGIP